MAKHQETAQLMEQEAVAHLTYRMLVHCPGIAREARAGQFAMLQVREGTDPLLRRPFSFHRVLREAGAVEILYRVVGRGTWLLSRMEPGATLSLLGPLGNGFRLPETDAGPVFLVAGGIGIAPIEELTVGLLEAAERGRVGALHLFYGARTDAELLKAERISRPGVRIHWSTDDGSRGFRGNVIQCMERVEEEGIRPALVYGCGPLAMQVRLALWTLRRGVEAQLSLESLMACGFGACLGCALPVSYTHLTLPTIYSV